MPQPRHLTDARLHELWERAAADPHLAACPSCRARLADLDRFTTAVTTAAATGFANAFPEPRVAASRQAILQAVERLQRPGEVVAFPGAPLTAPPRRARPRWMVAAAAGLMLGLAVGRWTHSVAPAGPGERPAAAGAPVAPVGYGALAEDDLLFTLETASTGPVAELRAIHELTPLSDQPDPIW